MAADRHEPVTGKATVSDDAAATVDIGGDQDNSDVAMDRLGRIHVTWQDQRTGRSLIMYARSDDRGRSFGPSIRVNDLHPSIEYLDPSIDVDDQGNPYIVWYDPRNSLTTGLDVFMARSFDGGDTFGPNVRVNTDTQNRPETSPDVAVGPGDRVFVVYMSGIGSQADIYMSTSEDGGRTFGPSVWVDGDASGKRQLSPVVTAGTDGSAHVAWTDLRSGNADIYYASRTPMGTMTSTLRVNDDSSGADQGDPAIVTYQDDAILVWRDDRNGNADVYVARGGPSGWGTNRRVNDDATTTNQVEPDIAVSAPAGTGDKPTVHVVWEGVGSGSFDIYMANSTDGAVSFDSESKVNHDGSPGAVQHLPSIAAMERGEGAVVVTWEDNGDTARGWDVLTSWSNDTVSMPAMTVSDDRTSAYEASPVTAVGPSGRLHAVWVDNRDGPYGVYYSSSVNGGEAWGSVTSVDGAPADHDHLTPDLAVGPDGTVHVAWTDRRGAQPTVWYANNKGKTSGFNGAVRVDDAPAGAFAVSPSLAVATNGSATVAWLDGRDGEARIRMTYSLNGGSTWQPSKAVPGAAGDGTSTMSPPDLAIREGLVAVGFTDDEGGSARPYVSMGPSVPGLEAPLLVETGPVTGYASSVVVALDADPSGPVHVAWSRSVVFLTTYDPVSDVLSEPRAVLDDTSWGPYIHHSLAAGDGGAVHLAWIDLEDDTPRAMLRTIVPDLEPPTLSELPVNAPVTSPSLAFAAHQLSCVLVEDGAIDPDIACAVWDNGLPPDPDPQAPPDEGWVTVDDFNITVGTGIDPDGDPVLVRFLLTTPGGEVIERPYNINPRFRVTGAEEGSYTCRALTTDGFGALETDTWEFTVDMTPPDVPAFDPVPEYTPGDSITLSWEPVSDPGGALVSYRVQASQDPNFNPPYLRESAWVTANNLTFTDLPTTTIHYRLFARDPAGNTVVAPGRVTSTQDDEAPKVFLRVDPALEAEEGEEVTFDATTSTDDHGIASYGWDFQSDGEVDSTEALTKWSFGEAGEYRITITIADLAGNEAVFSNYLMTILDITAPTIHLTVSPSKEVDEGTEVTFDATGTSDPSGIKVVRWFLDDEEVPFATGEVATKRFRDPGTFDVRMEAVDEWDNVANRTETIRVLDVTPPVVRFNSLGPFDNTKVEFFSIFVNVTDSGGVDTVVLYYKTQDAGLFTPVDMIRVEGSDHEWYKDELAPGGKGNATYYVKATDLTGNENKTDYQRIRVIGVEDPTPPDGNGDGGFDIMDYLWLIIILVIVVAVAVAAVAVSDRRKAKTAMPKAPAATKPAKAAKAKSATPKAAEAAPATQMMAAERKPARDRSLCAIEEVYFIHNDGRLVLASSSSAAADRDAQDVFAGMFTAIQDFIKDSMAQKGDLGSFDYGDNRIIIERGRYITCAVTIFGNEPGNLRDEIREVVRQVEGNYAGVIERWDGDKAKLVGITEFAKRILGLTGGVDRETVVRSREEKGVKLLSEVEFFQGFVRLKTAVKNDTETVITDAALDIVYDDNVLRLDHIQPVYEYKRGKVHLGNINAGEKKTVAFNYDPIICMESNIDGTLTFRDVRGKLQVVSMKTRRADIVCPIFFTRENANTAMLKRLVKEELASQDSKVFRYPDGLAPNQAFELCKGVVHLHDVKFVREFFEEKPSWLGEAWFYGETKVKGYKIVIRVTVREDSHTAEFFVASQEMEVITGLLAELGHSLNRMLKEKYMGRLKAQPIVDQRLKKELTDKPLLIEREA